MDTVEEHPHSFPASEWPFSEPSNLAAFTTTHVLREGYPVLLVSHDHDGDWQFLCGTTNDSAHGAIVCLGCAYQGTRALENWLISPLAGKLGGIPLTPLGSGFRVSQTRMRANNSFKPMPLRGTA